MNLPRQHILLSYFKTLSVGPVWGSNPRPSAQQTGALPTELTRRRRARSSRCCGLALSHGLVLYIGITSCTFPPWTELFKKNDYDYDMLVEECGCEITKGRSIIFLDQILSLFIKIRSFSYAKDIVQKYKIQQKATKKKGLRKDIKRATNQNVQG